MCTYCMGHYKRMVICYVWYRNILKIEWMIGVAGAYLAFLWLPVSPEKVITFAIAMALLRWLFPNDQKTLAVLREFYDKAKKTIQNRKEKRATLNKQKNNK